MQQRIFLFSYISCAYLLSVYTFLSEFCRFVYNVFHFYSNLHYNTFVGNLQKNFWRVLYEKNYSKQHAAGKTASLSLCCPVQSYLSVQILTPVL